MLQHFPIFWLRDGFDRLTWTSAKTFSRAQISGAKFFWMLAIALAGLLPARAVILWADLGPTLVHETGAGYDILNGAVKEDDSSTNTLYFKFHVDPLSDASTEEYFAAFELYEGDKERLGVGNALKAWAYSAFRADATGDSHEGSDYIDLHSSRPEPSPPGRFISYENPHRGIECTMVFKVQYIPGGNDLVTVWLNPDLGPGATEEAQPQNLITRFRANASFNEIHLRHGGGGDGWIFSDMAIATAFSDFVAANNNGAGEVHPPFASPRPLFTFQSWQSQQGLPQDYVRALAQTADGYLWVGTDDGVARFDGVRFVSFGLPEGMPTGPVQTLLADRDGALWIGTAGNGLTRWQAGKAQTFSMADGLPSDSITALAEDGQGRLWIGTEAGLAISQNGHLTPFAAGDAFKGKPITALFADRRGNVWLGATGTGVFEFSAGKVIPITDAATRELLRDPHCLLVDKAGRVWIGAGDDFVLCRDGNQWRPYRIPRHFARSYIGTLAEEPDGTVWGGSVSEGLFEFKDGKQVTFNAGSGLSDNSVASLFVDQEGHLWVGTAAGLNLLRQKNLFAFDQKQGLGYGAVEALAEITPGQIWVGMQAGGLYRWAGGNFRPLKSADLAIIGPQINSLLVAKDGSCWVAGVHGLLHFKNPKETANRADLFTLPASSIISLCEDPESNLWVGTREGTLWCWRNKHWLAETNFIQKHAITALAPGRHGSLWIGTEGDGVYRFHGATAAHWSTTNGLLSDLVRTLYPDAQGRLWIGTAGGGLGCWHQGRVTTITSREGLPDNTISQILEDDTGHLWLGSNRGIACVSKRELEEVAAGQAPAVYPQVYGRAEGMLSEQCTSGFFPSGLKSKSGELWFPTLKGVVVVNPKVHLSQSPPPKVLIEEVWVDGVAWPLTSTENVPVDAAGAWRGNVGLETRTLQLGPGRHRLELRYTALNFETPERTRFRYQLEGLDSGWVEAGTRRMAFYSYVPPGHYRFRVIACNADGVWNDAGASLGLVVARYFWQTWWFAGGVILALLALVVSVVRLSVKRRMQRRVRHLEQERALEQERSRIARDLHDEMGAKLCRISFLSEHARRSREIPEELRRQIVFISEASREVLYSLDEIVWAVNPQNDLLEHVASYIGHYAQEYFQETGIECEVNMPAQLPSYPLSSQWRHHLLLAVREAFTNTLKHSQATRVQVSITFNFSTLEIAVSDNGNGFDLSAHHPPKGNPASSAGNGLFNMHQRLQDIGGHCVINSQPGVGTTVRFVLPISRLKERALAT